MVDVALAALAATASMATALAWVVSQHALLAWQWTAGGCASAILEPVHGQLQRHGLCCALAHCNSWFRHTVGLVFSHSELKA